MNLKHILLLIHVLLAIPIFLTLFGIYIVPGETVNLLIQILGTILGIEIMILPFYAGKKLYDYLKNKTPKQ